METIGERLKELRKKKNLTLREVGEVLNMTPTAISCYESGTRTPSSEVVKILADLYETTTDFILHDKMDEKGSNIKYILNSNKLHWDGIPLNEEDLKTIRNFLEFAFRNKEQQKEKCPDQAKEHCN